MTISRNKLYCLGLILWWIARSACVQPNPLISFLSAEEVSVRRRCVWFGGQSRGEQDVQLAETWKENTLPGSHAQSLQKQ